MQAATSPDRWSRIKTLFAEAAELPSFARATWLAEACGEDKALREEVEKLLAADAQADDFLEAAPINQLGEVAQATREQLTEGESVGAYRIVRELGRGGMGTVYLAERRAAGFEQRVALKVIKRGMDSDEVLRRFIAERQILAQLNHPHIARLLDGGQTADGRPFYVMEYIEGIALDEFAQAHFLSVEERLQLFQQVCAAVQYAHQQLVIHRDLKPSNILVTAERTAKLLDFGIAKVLSPEGTAAATVTQAAMLTPAYASPEQLRGARLTTASDVYALGVILYELLTGVSPYQSKLEETRELTKEICETEPLRPSLRALRTGQNSSIDAELDYIAMMALRKEPTRRYASVEQFSEDIRHYLLGLPVKARPDTWRYRASKFIKRNRALTTASLAVALSLTGGLALTWRQARIAERERALAQRRFEDVRQLANKFVFDYHDELAKLQGSTALRQQMVSDAQGYLTRLSQDAAGDDTLQLELARAWIKIGDVQGKPYLANLGQTDEALKSYEQARQLAERVVARHPEEVNAQLAFGLALQSLGHLQTRAGQFKTALPLLEQAVTLLQNTPNPEFATQTALAQTYLALGDCLARSSPDRQTRAMEIYEQALRLNEKLLAMQPDDRTRRRRAMAILEQRLGMTLAQGAKTPQMSERARDHHQRATALLAAVAAAEPDNASAQRDLMDQYQMQAEVLARLGETERALADCQRAIAFFAQRAVAEPKNAEAQRDLATAHYIHCTIHQGSKNYAAALAAMQQAVAIYERLAARDPNNAENYQDLSSGYGRIADAERDLGHPAKSASARQRSREYQAKVAALRAR